MVAFSRRLTFVVGFRKLVTRSVCRSISQRYICRYRTNSLSSTGSTPTHLPLSALLTKYGIVTLSALISIW